MKTDAYSLLKYGTPLAVILILEACALPRDRVYIDDRAFTPEEYQEVVKGVDSWGGAFEITRDPFPNATVYVGRLEDQADGTQGMTIDKEVVLVGHPKHCAIHTVVAHELGHVLGLEHRLGVGVSIMHPACDLAADVPTREDLEKAK